MFRAASHFGSMRFHCEGPEQALTAVLETAVASKCLSPVSRPRLPPPGSCMVPGNLPKPLGRAVDRSGSIITLDTASPTSRGAEPSPSCPARSRPASPGGSLRVPHGYTAPGPCGRTWQTAAPPSPNFRDLVLRRLGGLGLLTAALIAVGRPGGPSTPASTPVPAARRSAGTGAGLPPAPARTSGVNGGNES
jgi:hypothetical protein